MEEMTQEDANKLLAHIAKSPVVTARERALVYAMEALLGEVDRLTTEVRQLQGELLRQSTLT